MTTNPRSLPARERQEWIRRFRRQHPLLYWNAVGYPSFALLALAALAAVLGAPEWLVAGLGVTLLIVLIPMLVWRWRFGWPH